MPVRLICYNTNCANEVKVTPSKFARQRIFFCSRRCYQKFVRSYIGRKWNSENLVGIKKIWGDGIDNTISTYNGWVKWCKRNDVDLGNIVSKEV